MRAAAEAAGGGPAYVKGEAEATGLPDRFADLVIGCQAFHWFDLDRALREIDRVLVPGGHAVAIWNHRADTPLMKAYDALLKARVRREEAGPSFPHTVAALRARRPAAVEAAFPNAQRLDREGLHGRAWSASYVVHGVDDAAGFDRALDDLFDRFAQDGAVTFVYETLAIAWSSPSS
jgi:SAM-dependent methyltransferase